MYNNNMHNNNGQGGYAHHQPWWFNPCGNCTRLHQYNNYLMEQLNQQQVWTYDAGNQLKEADSEIAGLKKQKKKDEGTISDLRSKLGILEKAAAAKDQTIAKLSKQVEDFTTGPVSQVEARPSTQRNNPVLPRPVSQVETRPSTQRNNPVVSRPVSQVEARPSAQRNNPVLSRPVSQVEARPSAQRSAIIPDDDVRLVGFRRGESVATPAPVELAERFEKPRACRGRGEVQYSPSIMRPVKRPRMVEVPMADVDSLGILPVKLTPPGIMAPIKEEPKDGAEEESQEDFANNSPTDFDSGAPSELSAVIKPEPCDDYETANPALPTQDSLATKLKLLPSAVKFVPKTMSPESGLMWTVKEEPIEEGEIGDLD